MDERCRDLAPSDLALTNANLGNALVTISERDNSNSMLEEAAMAYRAALAARPVNEAPLDTARTHIKLACALGGLWNRTRSTHVLNEALNAVEAALGLINEMPAHISAAALAPESIRAAMGHRDRSASAA